MLLSNVRYLMQYIRDNKNQKRGCLIAVGAGQVGFSLAHKKDKFDRYVGFEVAMIRATGGFNKDVPSSISDQFAYMIERSHRYFKSSVTKLIKEN